LSGAKDIFLAVTGGALSAVHELVSKDPNLVNAKSEDGLSVLMTAVHYGRKEIAEYLVNKGANVNIFEASALGDTRKLSGFVEQDPSLVNAFSVDGYTPLHLASFFGNYWIAKILVERRADVNSIAKNATKVMPLHSAAAGRHNDICELLVANGADVNAKQQSGFTPLHEAAMNGNLALAKLLLEKGARINEKSETGKTALDFAMMEGRESGPKEDRDKVADFLKTRGAVSAAET
jgi:ankyrin repeat protein